jgi:hypothetical protein
MPAISSDHGPLEQLPPLLGRELAGLFPNRRSDSAAFGLVRVGRLPFNLGRWRSRKEITFPLLFGIVNANLSRFSRR